MTCYECSRKSTNAVHLGKWMTVCKFHFDEALEQETGGLWSRTIENHLEVINRVQAISKTA